MEKARMSPETESRTPAYTLLDMAEGSIEAGADQQERLDELTERIASGEFHIETSSKIPYGCIDGRDTVNGIIPKANSAGGTESLFVADDLTVKRFAGESSSTSEAYANVLKFVAESGYEVGGHTDNHAHGEASGCGANDKLESIYSFIANNGDHLRKMSESLGVSTSDEAYNQIIENASSRTDFSSGRSLLDKLEQQDGSDIDELVGDHKEVLVVINTKPGTTLDRVLLKKEFGEDYEAFNVDLWSFKEAAETISLDNREEIESKVAAITFYNLATAHVLCGKNMRVVVL